MPPTANGPAMSQKIFSLNLGVETVSLYLLCCALADSGAAITETQLLDKWNGDRNSLVRELQRLAERGIITRSGDSSQREPAYRLRHEKSWH